MTAPVAATLDLDPAGLNNRMLYTAKTKGSLGNGISIEYANTATAGSETIGGTQLVVTVGVQNGVSTAAQVKTAVDGNSRSSSLVTVANNGGDNGTGTIPTTAPTSLAGGSDGHPDASAAPGALANRRFAADAILGGWADANVDTVLTSARAAGFRDDASMVGADPVGILGGVNR